MLFMRCVIVTRPYHVILSPSHHLLVYHKCVFWLVCCCLAHCNFGDAAYSSIPLCPPICPIVHFFAITLNINLIKFKLKYICSVEIKYCNYAVFLYFTIYLNPFVPKSVIHSQIACGKRTVKRAVWVSNYKMWSYGSVSVLVGGLAAVIQVPLIK